MAAPPSIPPLKKKIEGKTNPITITPITPAAISTFRNLYVNSKQIANVKTKSINGRAAQYVVVKKKTSIKDTGMTMIPITIIRRMSLSRRPKRLSSAQ